VGELDGGHGRQEAQLADAHIDASGQDLPIKRHHGVS
jgi:hypothetical protein